VIPLKFGLNVPARDGVHEREGSFSKEAVEQHRLPRAKMMDHLNLITYGEYNECHTTA
jgi:hypothetical protein